MQAQPCRAGFLFVLGPRKGLQVARLLRQALGTQDIDMGRRKFMQETALAALALFLLPSTSMKNKQSDRLQQITESQLKTHSPNAMSPTQYLEEAETARALAFRSQKLRRMQKTVAESGFRLSTNKQTPLSFSQENNGQRLFVEATGKQAVLFRGEKAGQRIYIVFLGLEASHRSTEGTTLEHTNEKKLINEDSFVIAVVSVSSRNVLDVIQLRIGSVDGNKTYNILMQSATGRQSRYVTTEDKVVL